MPERFSDEKDNHPSVELPEEEEEAAPLSLRGIMKRLLKINKPECCAIFVGMCAVIMKSLQVILGRAKTKTKTLEKGELQYEVTCIE